MENNLPEQQLPVEPTKKSKKSTLVVVLAVLALALAGAGMYGMSYYRYAVKNATLKSGYINVPTGTPFDEQVQMLVDNGYLASGEQLRQYARQHGYDKTPKAGRFKIDSAASYKQLLAVIGRGVQTPVKVTFNNIRTFQQLAARVARYIEADSASLMQVFHSDSLMREMGFDRQNFIGMFIPNTYELYWNTSALQFVQRMHTEYERFWKNRDQKLPRTGLSRQQAVTLASVVFEETKYQPEMARVAGVYINRLKVGMPLQADPTVKYALGDFTLRRVLNRHIDQSAASPYNTYKHAGLPPGPICIPEIAAVDAVLDYEENDFYYFCAAADLSGKHNFARTLAQHNVNRAAYIDAINKRGIR